MAIIKYNKVGERNGVQFNEDNKSPSNDYDLLISIGDISKLNNDAGYTTYSSSDFDTDFGNKTADNLTEGSNNKYYADDKVDTRVNNLLSSGTGISKSYDEVNKTLTITLDAQLSNLNDVDSVDYSDGAVLRGNGDTFVSSQLKSSDLDNDLNWDSSSTTSIKTIDADYTVQEADDTILIDASDSDMVIELPDPQSSTTKIRRFKRIDETTSNISFGTPSGTIEFGNEISLSKGDVLRLQHNGTDYFTV